MEFEFAFGPVGIRVKVGTLLILLFAVAEAYRYLRDHPSPDSLEEQFAGLRNVTIAGDLAGLFAESEGFPGDGCRLVEGRGFTAFFDRARVLAPT